MKIKTNILNGRNDDGSFVSFGMVDGTQGGYYSPTISDSGELTYRASDDRMPEIEWRNIVGPPATTDKTLSEAGKMADAQVVGEEFTSIDALLKNTKKSDIEIERRITNLEYALDDYLYRPEIDDTPAYIKTVPDGVLSKAMIDSFGGSSILWNQAFNGTERPVSYNQTRLNRIENGDGSFTYELLSIDKGSSGTYTHTCRIRNIEVVPGNVYGHFYRVKVSRNSKVAVGASTWAESVTIPADGEFHRVGFVSTRTSSTDFFMGFTYGQQSDLEVGDSFTIRDWMYFDLTEMFGEGNEPTLEQFYNMFPDDYYPYNPGEIISAGVSELESKGKNILDASADTLRYYRSDSYTSFNLNNGVVEITGGSLFGFLVPVEKHKNYTASISIDNPVQVGAFRVWGVSSFFEENFDGKTAGIIAYEWISSTSAFTEMALQFIPETDYVLVGLYVPEAGAGMVFRNFMLRFSDTPAEYTPYTEPYIITIPETIRSLPGYGETGSLVDFANGRYIAPDGTETDISTLLPDNVLEVEAGGTITFENERKLLVPNQITYLVKTEGG